MSPSIDNRMMNAFCFPSMQDDNHNNADSGESCELFRPMFGNDAGASSMNETVTDEQSALECARQTGYRKGYDQGRKEALETARKTMAPCLTDLIRSLERIDRYNQQITGKAAENIIRLAMAIAGQVLEKMPAGSRDTSTDTADTLQQTISAAYKLKLHLHPDTAAALRELVQSNQLSWPAGEFVSLVENPDLDCNSARLETAPQQTEIMRQQADACLESMVKTEN